MSVAYFPTGLNEALGDVLVTCTDLYVNGGSTIPIRYVHHDGNDAENGMQREQPKATLGSAVTAATAGDIIVMLDGHTETLTANVDITGLTVVGAGSSGGIPTVKLSNNQAADPMITMGAGTSQLLNVYIDEEVQACSGGTVSISSAKHAYIRGCYFKCGQYTDKAAVDIIGATDVIEIRNTTFLSAGTSRTGEPKAAVHLDHDVGVFILDGVVFDNGVWGWSDFFALDLTKAGNDVNYLYAENISLLRGADVYLCTQTNGYVNVGSSNRGAKVDWVVDCSGA